MRPYRLPAWPLPFPAILSSVIRQSRRKKKNRLDCLSVNSQDTLKESDLAPGYIKKKSENCGSASVLVIKVRKKTSRGHKFLLNDAGWHQGILCKKHLFGKRWWWRYHFEAMAVMVRPSPVAVFSFKWMKMNSRKKKKKKSTTFIAVSVDDDVL